MFSAIGGPLGRWQDFKCRIDDGSSGGGGGGGSDGGGGGGGDGDNDREDDDDGDEGGDGDDIIFMFMLRRQCLRRSFGTLLILIRPLWGHPGVISTAQWGR